MIGHVTAFMLPRNTLTWSIEIKISIGLAQSRFWCFPVADRGSTVSMSEELARYTINNVIAWIDIPANPRPMRRNDLAIVFIASQERDEAIPESSLERVILLQSSIVLLLNNHGHSSCDMGRPRSSRQKWPGSQAYRSTGCQRRRFHFCVHCFVSR